MLFKYYCPYLRMVIKDFKGCEDEGSMEFIVKGVKKVMRYEEEERVRAVEFAEKLRMELKDFVVCVVLFGSKARSGDVKKGDLDILVVIDDVKKELTPDVLKAYQMLALGIAKKVSENIHLTTMKLSIFWELAKQADPIFVNMLRDGVPVYDLGFFEPMQALLEQGRMNATPESIWTYLLKAPNAIDGAKGHLLQAGIDLYWAVLDAAHAALMSIGETPPTPAHIPELIEERFVKPKHLEAVYAEMLKEFFKLYKLIQDRHVKELSGVQYDKYAHDADLFVERMHKIISSEAGKIAQHEIA